MSTICNLVIYGAGSILRPTRRHTLESCGSFGKTVRRRCRRKTLARLRSIASRSHRRTCGNCCRMGTIYRSSSRRPRLNIDAAEGAVSNMNGITFLLNSYDSLRKMDGRKFRVTASSRRKCATLVRKPEWSRRQASTRCARKYRNGIARGGADHITAELPAIPRHCPPENLSA